MCSHLRRLKLLLATGLVAATAVHAELPRVLIIGDSISVGYTQWATRFLRGKAEVHRVPANCRMSAYGLENIEAWLGAEDWDVIHFNFGLHDITHTDADGNRYIPPDQPGARHQVPAEDYERNLRELVSRMQKRARVLVWGSTTPVPAGTRYRIAGDEVIYNAIAARVMEEQGVLVNDLYAFAKPRVDELQLPGDVHFKPEGYQALGKEVAGAIEEALATAGVQPATASDFGAGDAASYFVPVRDVSRVVQHGKWSEGGGPIDGRARNRYNWPLHLRTKTPGAALELAFEGTGLAVVFHTPRVRAYGGQWRDGHMLARVDDGDPVAFVHDQEALEVIMAQGLPPETHRAVLEHLTNGCTLAGFRVFRGPVGHVAATVTGDNPELLFDVRVEVWQGTRRVRSTLNRNWLSERVRVTGLPPGDGYRIEIEAVGWTPWERDGITIRANETLDLGDIHLAQDPATIRGPLSRPALGYPVVRIPGATFELEGGNANWTGARLVRVRGPAVISRRARVSGRSVQLPDDIPPGVYDLQLVSRTGDVDISPRSVVVRNRYPSGDLTVLTWGHTDTWGQHQAEFERVLIAIANAIGPDLVLVSNSLNPGYVAGAMAGLDAPYLINFGNHALHGHERWFGPQTGLVDLGPEVVVVNWGLRWREDTAELYAMLESRRDVPGTILNTFESDWPMELFERNDIRLVHDAHGWLKPRVQILPGTETMRVGKVSASSFRIVRMAEHRVVSVSDPFEIPRIDDPVVARVPDPPLRIIRDRSTAEIINELPVAIPRARVAMVLPAGDYRAEHGDIESQARSDDGKWVELILRTEVPAESTRQVVLHQR